MTTRMRLNLTCHFSSSQCWNLWQLTINICCPCQSSNTDTWVATYLLTLDIISILISRSSWGVCCSRRFVIIPRVRVTFHITSHHHTSPRPSCPLCLECKQITGRLGNSRYLDIYHNKMLVSRYSCLARGHCTMFIIPLTCLLFGAAAGGAQCPPPPIHCTGVDTMLAQSRPIT